MKVEILNNTLGQLEHYCLAAAFSMKWLRGSQVIVSPRVNEHKEKEKNVWQVTTHTDTYRKCGYY